MASDLWPGIDPQAGTADDGTATTHATAPAEIDTPVRAAAQEAHTAEIGPVRGASLEAVRVSAWFGTHKVLERVSLAMPPGIVTALIGPSGCGKSTFLRILNRMHETVVGAKLGGQVLLDGRDIYTHGTRVTEMRGRIGMVFQKPNPFPAMSIAENVLAGIRLTGIRIGRDQRIETLEQCLRRAGLIEPVLDLRP
jgi:phosphate transport system ATP-binding protein